MTSENIPLINHYAEGYSETNLKYMKQFYLFYSKFPEISQQVADQLTVVGENPCAPKRRI
jgi:hypothetical protein